MLQFIREYDYSSCTKNVAKLHDLAHVEGAEPMCEIVIDILEFFRSAVETIGVKLTTCNNCNEYDVWCHSHEARKISHLANDVLHNLEAQRITHIAKQVRVCAEDVAYLVSSKCATFYNED